MDKQEWIREFEERTGLTLKGITDAAFVAMLRIEGRDESLMVLRPNGVGLYSRAHLEAAVEAVKGEADGR